MTVQANATYTSVWDGGVELESQAYVNPETREVVVLGSHEDEVDILDREFVTFEGREYLASHASSRSNYTPEEQSLMFFYN